jgi:predicted transcriptional regulator
MTTTVVSVEETTSYDEIVDIMVTRGISAVPVVAADGWVAGTVEGRGTGPLLVSLVETVPGVVNVVDHLTSPDDMSRRATYPS